MCVDRELVIATLFGKAPGPKSDECQEPEIGDKENRQQPGHRRLRSAIARNNHERNDAKRQVNNKRDGDPEGSQLHQRGVLDDLAIVDELQVDVEIRGFQQSYGGL